MDYVYLFSRENYVNYLYELFESYKIDNMDSKRMVRVKVIFFEE